MSKRKKLDDKSKYLLEWLEKEDPFGLDEELVIVTFLCKDCGKEDEVPEYVIEEFSVDLKDGQEVELECPFCGGTLYRAKDVPSD